LNGGYEEIDEPLIVDDSHTILIRCRVLRAVVVELKLYILNPKRRGRVAENVHIEVLVWIVDTERIRRTLDSCKRIVELAMVPMIPLVAVRPCERCRKQSVL